MADMTFNYGRDEKLENLENNLLTLIKDKIDSFPDNLTNDIFYTILYGVKSVSGYNFQNMSDYQIKKVIREYLDNLLICERKHIRKIVESLEKVTISTIKLSEKRKDIASIFKKRTNDIIRNQPSLHRDINNKAVQKINDYVVKSLQYFDNSNLISTSINSNVIRIINTYSKALSDELTKTLDKLLEEYREKVLKSSQEKKEEEDIQMPISKEISKEQFLIKENNISLSVIQILKHTAEKAGLKIEENLNGFTVKDLKTNRIQVLYKDKKGKIFSKDHHIEMQNLWQNGIMIINGNKVFRENLDSFYMGTKDNPNLINLVRDLVDYKIIYAGEEQNNLLKKGVIIDCIQKEFPNFFKYLTEDIIFMNLLSNIEKKKKEKAKFHNNASSKTSSSKTNDVIKEKNSINTTNELLQELEANENNLGIESNVENQTIENQGNIDDEIFKLSEDSTVQRYIALMKMQEEQNALVEETKFQM